MGMTRGKKREVGKTTMKRSDIMSEHKPRWERMMWRTHKKSEVEGGRVR